MSKTREDLVKEFCDAFGVPQAELTSNRTLTLGMRLISEETQELYGEIVDLKAMNWGEVPFDPEVRQKLLKELADLQYVISQFAIRFHLPLQEAFERVHASNMSKLDEDGKPIYREDGKVLKGPNYQPPDLSDLV